MKYQEGCQVEDLGKGIVMTQGILGREGDDGLM